MVSSVSKTNVNSQKGQVEDFQSFTEAFLLQHTLMLHYPFIDLFVRVM